MASWRVPAGYAAFVAVFALARPRTGLLITGFAMALLGQALRLWASGHIEKARALATGGPYAHTRNPLYLGSALMGLGVAVASASPWAALVILAYLGVFYPLVIAGETAFLRERFGDEYARWAAEVPLFLPRLTPAGPRATRFSWERVRGNREWRTALALPLLAALLWARRLLG